MKSLVGVFAYLLSQLEYEGFGAAVAAYNNNNNEMKVLRHNKKRQSQTED